MSVRTGERAMDGHRRSLWIPWALVGIFAVFLLANGAMLYFAGRSWTGLETQGAYDKGLAYNETLAAADAQRALGWQVAVEAGTAGEGEAWIEAKLQDREGRALAVRRVWARLVRPTHVGYDRESELLSIGGGRYRGRIELPLPGQWDLRLYVEHSDGIYQTTHRVILSSDG